MSFPKHPLVKDGRQERSEGRRVDVWRRFLTVNHRKEDNREFGSVRSDGKHDFPLETEEELIKPGDNE